MTVMAVVQVQQSTVCMNMLATSVQVHTIKIQYFYLHRIHRYPFCHLGLCRRASTGSDVFACRPACLLVLACI